MHDPDAVAVEQRVELRAQRAERARLDLDELAVGAHEVDHVAAHAASSASPGRGEVRLERRVERALPQLADPGHAQPFSEPIIASG